MKCKECNGKVYTNVTVRLQTGYGGCGGNSASAHPCKKCGRLHWANGETVFNRGGKKAYLEGTSVVHK